MWPTNSFPTYGNQPNGFAAPKPNSNFSNFNTAFAQVQPKPGQGIASTTNMPWNPNTPNMGFNPGPNMGLDPNAGYTPMGWQDTKPDWFGGDYFAGLKTGTKAGDTKTDGKDGKDGYKPLSGSGSISGSDFKTGSGEIWTPAVKAGQTYNLLSDGGVGLNGTFMKSPSSGENVLGSIGLKVGDSNITLASDGTLLVDGEKYNKSKNSLKGLVSEKDGTVTVKTNEGYTFTLKARGDEGIKVEIKADNVGKDGIAPDGLWGALFDGEKQTERELKKVRPRDFEISDDLKFDYEDNNALTNQKTLDDEDRGDQLFKGKNPEGQYGFGIRGNTFNSRLSGKGELNYAMDALKDGKIYNLFSDEEFQLNGKFKSNKLDEVGGMVGETKLQVKMGPSGGRPEIYLDGKKLEARYEDPNGVWGLYLGGELYKGGQPNLYITDNDTGPVWGMKYTENGEDYQVYFGQKDGGLAITAMAWNQGGNDTRTTGLLGDSLTNGHSVDNGNDKNGAGYLRNADGLLSKAGEKMSGGLSEYMVDSLYETEGGRSVY